MMRALSSVTLIASALTCVGALAAEPLGRLFFTPAQRSALDAGSRIGEPRVARPPAPQGPRELKLNGVVTRSDGESAIWVNGSLLSSEPQSWLNATVSSSDPIAAQMKPRGLRKSVRLRVGQHVDAMTGKITEAYDAPLYPVSITPLVTNSTGGATDTKSPSSIAPDTAAPSGDTVSASTEE